MYNEISAVAWCWLCYMGVKNGVITEVKNGWSVRLSQVQLAPANSDGYTAEHTSGFLQVREPVELSSGILGTRDSLGVF